MNGVLRDRILACAAGVVATAALMPFAGEVLAQGAVFTSTNALEGNAVVMYDRADDGRLTRLREFPTGGTGTGGGLGNQGALAITQDGRWLLAVNAGSNDVSVFRVREDRLSLTDVEPSRGELPVSIAIMGNLVYVLNGGGPGGIVGFTLEQGELTFLSGSQRMLSGAPITAPAQVGFSPDGETLVVTEKATSLIDTYTVDTNGRTDGPLVSRSSGVTPFGFGFTSRGTLIVSEAFDGAPGESAVSSYKIGQGGSLRVITASAPTTETAACWIAVTRDDRFTYTTNTGSGTITGFMIHPRRSTLSVLNNNGVTARTGRDSAPTDIDFSEGDEYLYTLNVGTGEIDVFAQNPSTGSLTRIQSIDGLPMSATGLVAK